LGLTITYDIILKHQGRITAENNQIKQLSTYGCQPGEWNYHEHYRAYPD
jgi:signal transduction histidine kinase